jgi:predicted ArsR family transcriptional regulator
MTAVEIAERLGIDRTTVHRHLARLLLVEKVESKNGIWRAITGKQAIKPSERKL